MIIGFSSVWHLRQAAQICHHLRHKLIELMAKDMINHFMFLPEYPIMQNLGRSHPPKLIDLHEQYRVSGKSA